MDDMMLIVELCALGLLEERKTKVAALLLYVIESG